MPALDGLQILILEDEYLIAMDVEQLCRDHGAHDVRIIPRLEELPADLLGTFDVAIVDLKLEGQSTLPFAELLLARGKPFVFATGYTDNPEITAAFPGVPVVGKPYSGSDVINAVASVCGRAGETV